MIFSGFPSKTSFLLMDKRTLFAKNLREARLKAGLTQIDVSEKTGLSQSFISDVEQGISDASLQNSCLLAEAVGQTVCKLISSKEP
jgi:transcriptional regulator with XRE-family HTH domain